MLIGLKNPRDYCAWLDVISRLEYQMLNKFEI